MSRKEQPESEPELGKRIRFNFGNCSQPVSRISHVRAVSHLKPGTVFPGSYLRVIQKISAYGEKNSRYLTQCIAPHPEREYCGVLKEVARCQLVSGDTRSCGCQKNALHMLALANGKPDRTVRKERIRDPSKRCPECRNWKALKPVYSCVDGTFVDIGRWCKYCQKLVAPPPEVEKSTLL